MDRLADVVKEVFPTLDRSTVAPSLRLGDIPNWDSMSAVNLLMLTEAAFKVTLLLL